MKKPNKKKKLSKTDETISKICITWMRITMLVVIGIFTYLMWWGNLLNLPNWPYLYFLFKFIIWAACTDFLLRIGELI